MQNQVLIKTIYRKQIQNPISDEPEVGDPLILTSYIERGELEKAAEMAAVKSILQVKVSSRWFQLSNWLKVKVNRGNN